MYIMVMRADYTVLYTWKVLKAHILNVLTTHTQLTRNTKAMWTDGCANLPYCVNHFATYTYVSNHHIIHPKLTQYYMSWGKNSITPSFSHHSSLGLLCLTAWFSSHFPGHTWLFFPGSSPVSPPLTRAPPGASCSTSSHALSHLFPWLQILPLGLPIYISSLISLLVLDTGDEDTNDNGEGKKDDNTAATKPLSYDVSGTILSSL